MITAYVHFRKISNLFVHALETGKQSAFGDTFCPVSQRVQLNDIFSDNLDHI
jgi:hypothetical protein